MPTLSPAVLQAQVQRIFAAAGASEANAERVAQSLVRSNLAGHDSHGVIRVLQYLEDIGRGHIVPNAVPEITRETQTTLAVDGHWGFGQVVTSFAVAQLVTKARRWHVAAGVLARTNHIGRLGEYVEQAAAAGLFALLACNSRAPGGTGIVAPYGGAERMFSTAPMAFAFPGGQHPPIVADFATSAVAEGKLRIARNRGQSIPAGWVIDKEGHTATDPNAFYDGGALLPFGGHKGYSLAFLGELLGGILSGVGPSPMPNIAHGNGTWILLLDINAFMPLAEFTATSDRLVERVKQTRPMAGYAEVMVPGEPEARTRAQRMAEGIFIEDITWDTIRQRAADFGVTLTAG